MVSVPTSTSHLRILIIDRNDKVFPRHTESNLDIHIIPCSESLLACCAVTYCLFIFGLESMSTESRLLARTILRCFLGEGGEAARQSSNINSTQSKLQFSSPSSSNQIIIAFRRSSPNTKEPRKEKKNDLCLAVDKKRDSDCPMSQVIVLQLNAPSRNVPSICGAFKFRLVESLQTLKENPDFFYEKGQIKGQF
jgi:hypothetical protein